MNKSYNQCVHQLLFLSFSQSLIRKIWFCSVCIMMIIPVTCVLFMSFDCPTRMWHVTFIIRSVCLCIQVLEKRNVLFHSSLWLNLYTPVCICFIMDHVRKYVFKFSGHICPWCQQKICVCVHAASDRLLQTCYWFG